MYHQLRDLSNRPLILTVNRRLALRLQQNLASDKTKPAPAKPIYALNDWFMLLWQELQARGETDDLSLLSSMQEQAIWFEILQESEQGGGLLQPYQTAKQLMATWKLIWQWDLQLNDMDWGQQEEGLLFYGWAKQFEQILLQKGWLTQAQLPTELLTLVLKQSFQRVQKFCPNQHVLWVGFDDIPPQVQLWIHAFKDAGWQLDDYHLNNQAELQRFEFVDPEQELTQAALHAKKWAQEHDGVFALIVPDLSRSIRKVENTLNQVCDPKACLNPEREVSWQFNISAGQPLAEQPIVKAVLISLELINENIKTQSLMTLLQSPFIVDDYHSQTDGHAFCFTLKQKQQLTFSVDELSWLADTQNFKQGQQLVETLRSLKPKWIQSTPISRRIPIMSQWLKRIGWPGKRPLNSIEHQAMQSFYQCLNTWQALDKVYDSLSVSQAVSWLIRLCQDSPFQPESRPAKIQVMGLLEAAGQEFDQAWVVGLNHESWPAPPKPNAFIPLALQKQLKMPHASAERELQFATHLTQTLKCCAPKVTFSHALSDQGKHYFASPLTADVQANDPSLITHQSIEAILRQHKNLIDRVPNSPVPLEVHEEIHGGVSVLQDQAACPFKAFAKHRLHAYEPEKFQEGIASLERGKIVHRALELIWKQLKDHATLCATPEEALKQRIDDVLTTLESDSKLSIKLDLYWTIEKRRLEKLLLAWLSLEKQRHPFKVVRQEAKTKVTLKGLTLNCRIDRVDLTENGAPIIIDYKTGKNQLNDCFGARPDAPQLPMYCFADFPPNPKGVVFALLRRGEIAFVGITEQEEIPGSGVSLVNKFNTKENEEFSNWEELIVYWRYQLEELAQKFIAGSCEVDPKNRNITCLHCDLSAFCRVGEMP